MGVFSFIRRLLTLAIVVAVAVALIHFWLNNKKYTFSNEAIAAVAKKYSLDKNVGKSVKELYKLVYKDLKTHYPERILAEGDLQWIFMNAGGWMGSMCLLHASLTEYVLFFGAALETSGHSGRYWANISDTVLTGEFRQWKEGELQYNVYKPGVTVDHVWGEVTTVNFKDGTWMVEYGRGFIPSTLGFALADTLFSTQDFVTLYYILRVYAKALAMEISYYITHPQEFF